MTFIIKRQSDPQKRLQDIFLISRLAGIFADDARCAPADGFLPTVVRILRNSLAKNHAFFRLRRVFAG
jgi:hypothetical protein